MILLWLLEIIWFLLYQLIHWQVRRSIFLCSRAIRPSPCMPTSDPWQIVCHLPNKDMHRRSWSNNLDLHWLSRRESLGDRPTVKNAVIFHRNTHRSTEWHGMAMASWGTVDPCAARCISRAIRLDSGYRECLTHTSGWSARRWFKYKAESSQKEKGKKKRWRCSNLFPPLKMHCELLSSKIQSEWPIPSASTCNVKSIIR